MCVAALLSSCADLGPSVVRTPVGQVADSALAGAGPTRCELPPAGADFEMVAPEAVGVDGAAVRATIDELSTPMTRSLRIYRHGCLIGQSRRDLTSAHEPAPLFSMTKSVVALAVGRAVTLGAVELDSPIGRYLSDLDAAHAAITVRQLLTQTSGLRFGWVNDLLGSTEDSVGEAMSMPFAHEPGTVFEYAQTTVTTLAFVVERAVGQDFQAFVSEQLFEPIGILPGTWRWSRDGVGHTQGYAWLDLTPADMARLGSLTLARGEWRGEQLIDAGYIGEMDDGTAANAGYGFLSQTNVGQWHIGTFGGVRRERRVIASAPPDTLIFSGFLEQATYVVPSLDLVVVRFGLPPEAQWKDHLFRSLLPGIPGAAVFEGPVPPADPIDWDWSQILDIGALIRRNEAIRTGLPRP